MCLHEMESLLYAKNKTDSYYYDMKPLCSLAFRTTRVLGDNLEHKKEDPMIRAGQMMAVMVALGLCLATPATFAATKKKNAKVAKHEKHEARKPASAGKGFKVKMSGDFTRVIDEEQGIVCYFAKQGGGSCVNLPR